MTIKNLFENEELLNNIMEDLDDIPEDAEVLYAVWALGCTSADEPTNTEFLIGEFVNPEEAIACAKKITANELINEIGLAQPDPTLAYFSVEVETVIADPDDEDCGTMNIGTLFTRSLTING